MYVQTQEPTNLTNGFLLTSSFVSVMRSALKRTKQHGPLSSYINGGKLFKHMVTVFGEGNSTIRMRARKGKLRGHRARKTNDITTFYLRQSE